MKFPRMPILLILGIVGVFSLVILPTNILADVQLVAPPTDEAESFPESFFGSPPAAPDLGAGPKDRVVEQQQQQRADLVEVKSEEKAKAMRSIATVGPIGGEIPQ